MQIVVLGISHQTATVEIREKLSFSESELPGVLVRLLECSGILEGIVLSTCNRTEIYALVNSPEAAKDALLAFWTAEKSFPLALLAPYLYYHAAEDAARHLHRVTAGIDSLIVGEGQILAQVKTAMATSQACHAAGQYLETLFCQALTSGKAVRTETNIGRGSVSVSSAAVEVATKAMGDLQNKVVLIYGAGKMSSHTIQGLFSRGAKQVYIVNRTLARAQETAARLGGVALSVEEGQAWNSQADVIIACTASPHYLLTPENFDAAPHKSRLLIDIAVPRNIDPRLGEMPGVQLVDLDGLEAVARANREGRESQILDAEMLIDEQLKTTLARIEAFSIAPAIEAFTGSLEALSRAELADFKQRNKGLLARDPEAALARFAHELLGRLMHLPMARLKALPSEERAPASALLASLFDLEIEDATKRYLRKRMPKNQAARLVAQGTRSPAQEPLGG